MNNYRPIFIVGAPRSGTTLVAEVLGRHPNIFIFNETLFYDFIASKSKSNESPEVFQLALAEHLKRRLALRSSGSEDSASAFGCRFSSHEIKKIDEAFTRRLKNCEHSNADILAAFMEAICEVRGKVRWGEKTPNHTFHLDRIVSDFPDAKIVFVVRDPRKFVRSYKYSWRQKGGRRSSARLYHPLVTSILWKRSINAFRKFSGAADTAKVQVVAYEDLKDNKSAALQKLCVFLDETFQPSMLDVDGSNTSFSQGNIELSLYELAVCEGVCGRVMAKAGYEPVRKPLVRWAAVLISTLSLPWFLARALPVVLGAFDGGMWSYLKARGFLSN